MILACLVSFFFGALAMLVYLMAKAPEDLGCDWEN